jgi:uncharacterized protein YndB with AHSA1/START domain
VLIVLAAAFISTRPSHYHVDRSLVIAAPPEVVFAHINDLHHWNDWSPWAKKDPNMKESYEGAASGVGASYHWTGNDQVGEGRMTIIESVPSQKVAIKLDFIKPFPATSTARLALLPEGGGTNVEWSLDGENNFMGKAMSVVTSMDKMIGPDFEQGLRNLKSVTETAASAPATTPARADSAH